MTDRIRTHIDQMPEGRLASRHLTKQQFGQRLYQLMLAHGWNQSELARQADLPRDAISTYVRGRLFPTPKNLQALAQAFGLTPAEILPNTVESAIESDIPSLDIRSSTAAPGTAWVRLNRLVELKTAQKILEIINDDKYNPPANRDKSADPA